MSFGQFASANRTLAIPENTLWLISGEVFFPG